MVQVNVAASQLNRLLLPPCAAALGTSNRHRSTSMSLLLCLQPPSPAKAQAHNQHHARKAPLVLPQMSLGHRAPLHVALLQPLHSSHMEWPRTPHAGTPLSLPVPMARLSEKATCVWTRTGTAVAAPRVSAGGAGAPVERIGGRQVEAQLRQHLRKTP